MELLSCLIKSCRCPETGIISIVKEKYTYLTPIVVTMATADGYLYRVWDALYAESKMFTDNCYLPYILNSIKKYTQA